jgi:hypothetical protein
METMSLYLWSITSKFLTVTILVTVYIEAMFHKQYAGET